MNFLAPQFFYGLFALAIPVIIHLFNFRRTKKIYFSSNKYLKKVSDQTSSRRNIKHLLILLSRILFLTALVLAFCQPIIPAKEDSLRNRVQIYLDNSQSMINNADVELSAFDLSIQYANQIVDQYPTSTRFRLLTNDFAPFSNRFRSSVEVKELLTELRFSRFGRTTGEVYERIIAEESELSSDIYWISDFQQSFATPVMADSSIRLRLIPIAYPSVKNIYIDTLYTNDPFVQSSEKLTLTLRLVNTGSEDVSNLVTRIFIDDAQITSNSFDIAAGSSSEAEFDISMQLNQSSKGRISFEDFPVSFDNDFYFVLAPGKKVKVIEIKGDDASLSIQNVYGNTSVFDFTSFPESNIDFEVVESADIILLHGVNSLGNSFQSLLNSLVAEGKHLAFIPGKNPQLDQLQGLIQGATVNQLDTIGLVGLDVPDYNNPFFDGVFEEESRNMSMPDASSLVRWPVDRDAILKLKNGLPFLSQFNRQGRVYVFATPFFPEYTNFMQHALFVPVMYKMALLSMENSEELYYTMNQRQIRVQVDSMAENELVRLRRDGAEMIPVQRKVGQEILLELPLGELNSGYYDLLTSAGLTKVLAFNYPESESRLEAYDLNSLGNLFVNVTPEVLTDVEDYDLGQRLKTNYEATELWKYFILLAILFLIAEILIFKFVK